MIRYPCECSDDDVGHDYVSERKAEEKILYLIECSSCLAKSEIEKEEWDLIASDELKEASRKRTHLTKYPRIEPHTGEVVKSLAHEKEVVKRMGFHEAPHGINESFNDELSEKLRKKIRETKDRIKRSRELRRRQA